MAERATSIAAGALVAEWRTAALTTAPEEEAIVAFLRERAAAGEPTLAVKILSAVGTTFATTFFLAFLGVSRLIDFTSPGNLVGWGIVAIAGGIVASATLRRMAVGVGRELTAQATFTAMAIGKVLIVAGVVTWGHGAIQWWTVTAALAAVTVATYPVSGSSLDRLLSPYAVIASALFDILETRVAGAATGATLTVFFVGLTAIAGGLLLPMRAPPVLRPIGLAALAGMGTIVAVIASGHDFGIWAGGAAIDPRGIEAVLTAALAGLIVWAAGGPAAARREGVVAAVVGAIALGFIGAPGIVYALGLLVLGHAHHDRPLRVVGILALPAFVVLWYYGRDMTFLAKSAALVGSGLVLLAARGFMAWRGLDRREAA